MSQSNASNDPRAAARARGKRVSLLRLATILGAMLAALVFTPTSLAACAHTNGNNAPSNPASLKQYKSDGVTAIASGGSTSEMTVIMTWTADDSDVVSGCFFQNITPWIEIRPSATAFSGTCGTATGTSGNGVFSGDMVQQQTTSAVTLSVTLTNLPAGAAYHWRACSRDNGCPSCSPSRPIASTAWVAKGATPDFTITNNAPSSPTLLKQTRSDGTTVIASGGFTNQTSVGAILSMQDADANQTLTPWIEIRPSATAFSGTCGVGTGAAGNGVLAAGSVAAPTANTAVLGGGMLTGLTSGAAYHWRVCVQDQAGAVSAWVSKGATPDFLVDTAPPATGTASFGSLPTYSTSSTVTVPASGSMSDTGGSGLASMQLQRELGTLSGGSCGAWSGSWTNVGSVVTTLTSTSSTGHSTNTCVHFLLVGTDNATNTFTSPTSGDVKVDMTTPTPGPMTATVVVNSSTQVTVTATAGADSGSGLNTLPYSVDTGTAAWQASQTFVKSGLAANTAYSWTVRIRDAAGNVGTGTVSAHTLPNAPSSPSAVAQSWSISSSYAIQLSWVAPSGGASSYNVRSSADGYASVVATGTTTSKLIVGLAANTTYTYKICSVNAGGSEQPTCTSTASATTPPVAPTALSSSAIDATSTTFAWTAAPGATKYELVIYPNATCTTGAQITIDPAVSPQPYASLLTDRTYTFSLRSYSTTSTTYGQPTACTSLSSSTQRTGIAVGVTASSVNLGTGAPGMPLAGATTITTQTYGAPGYTVSASVDHQLQQGATTVPATTSGSIATPGAWSGTGFGITLSSATNLNPKWGAGTKYAALTTTPTQIHTTGAAFTPNTVNTTTTVIGYKLVASASQATGGYSSTITYTVTPTA